jgi:hypothetical protein
MKVAVYAIAKNEERFAARWAEACGDADYRIVLDTGSSDRTVEILRSKGVQVISASVEPWRFDDARNLALSRVPDDADVCVSLDLDEVLWPESWRASLEAAWWPETSRLDYPDIRAWNPDGSPQRALRGFKIHSRHGYAWRYAIHEVLVPTGKESVRHTDLFQIHHHPDPGKSRAYYSRMLESLVQAEPEEPHYRYYWAQELIRGGRIEESIRQLDRFLGLGACGQALWASNAFRLKAWCKHRLGRPVGEVYAELLSCASAAPSQREAWAGLSAFCGENGWWAQAFGFAFAAARCTDPSSSLLIDPALWNGKLELMLESSAAAIGAQEWLCKQRASERPSIGGRIPSSCLDRIRQVARDGAASRESWQALALESAKHGEWPLCLLSAQESLSRSEATCPREDQVAGHLLWLSAQRMSMSPCPN